LTDSQAVFLSYASQDAEAAGRIAVALTAAGIEVWFDRSELRGGDAWDASIRKQIRGCRLFLPIVSAHTEARPEGYFRLEWKLAVDRSHLMADDEPFVVPVVVDGTLDATARVPDKFRQVQWTRLPDGETSAAFVERLQGLMSRDALAASAAPIRNVMSATTASEPARRSAVAPGPARHRRMKWLTLAIPLLAIVLAAFIFIPPWQKKEHARNVILPDIQAITSQMVRSNGELLDKALEVEKYLPNDPTLAKLWPLIATPLSIETEPAGAEVFWKDYGKPDSEWRSAGITPLKGVKVARNHLRVEIRKKGYQTVEITSPRPYSREGGEVPRLKLDALGTLPENMVRIPASSTEMNIVGLERYGDKKVPEFLVDKFEVTNAQFKTFVDAGGYGNAAYWRFPIVEAGKVIPLAVALAIFKDRTGRPGPATWEAGTYPDGMGNHPVTGVSWYEAAAYAEYAKKQLPSAFHWAQIADTYRTEFLVPFSNFSGKSTTAVGSLPGLSSYGVYDVAGNAREWIFNLSEDPSQRFILGGGWTDPVYAFNDSYTQAALDRSDSNGFRCIRDLSDSSTTAELRKPISVDFRDYAKETPVDEKTFANFARQFVYDKKPLDAKIDKVIETDSWKAEVVSINAAYNNERMQIYVYTPLHAAAQLQPVVYFPGSNAIFESHFDPKGVNNLIDFIVKSRRAIIYPIYKGTFERQDGLKSDTQEATVNYKDHVIMWAKDIGRTIDYLESRKDMRADAVAYLGISWGGFMGGILPAVEKRIRVVVLNVGGMEMQQTLSEVDQINFVPRITQPVLMLNGQYDMYFPVETAQKPMFNLLGTPKSQKKMMIYASGHRVPPVEFIKETLGWLDTYLGPVR
jgi:hypothetical protein